MFLYPYSDFVRLTEGSNWGPVVDQLKQENRVPFSAELYGPPNGRVGNENNGYAGIINSSGSGQTQMSIMPHPRSSFIPENVTSSQQFQELNVIDEKPLLKDCEMEFRLCDYNVKEKCRTCGKELLHGDMIQHMRNHMGPRRCEICNYEAPTKHHLLEHLNTHTGQKPFTCQFCDKSFAAKNSLRVHTMYIHTKIRQHQCQFCDQRFVTTSERKSHELVHTDKCPICQISFRLRSHLRQHVKTHANSAFHHKKRL